MGIELVIVSFGSLVLVALLFALNFASNHKSEYRLSLDEQFDPGIVASGFSQDALDLVDTGPRELVSTAR